jgi:hypothetical protein
VQQAAYGCNWYHRLRRFNRLLAVVIMRAQKPVRLKAGMFYDASLTTFTQVRFLIIIIITIIIIIIIIMFSLLYA